MASIFKRTFSKIDAKTGRRTKHKSKVWYIKYKDGDKIERRVKGYSDKEATRQKAAQLERQADRRASGLKDAFTDHLTQPVSEHIADFRLQMESKGRSARHVGDTERLLKGVCDACDFKNLVDVANGGAKLGEHIAKRLDAEVSHRTVNADLVAVRSFCRWLQKQRRLEHDPTISLARLNESTDRRHNRRALSEAEALKLVAGTRDSKRTFRGLDGLSRALLYAVALGTGLRRGELKSLTGRSFDLASESPTVVLEARSSKRRKQDVLPLAKSLAAVVKKFLADRDADQRVWPGGWWGRAADMLKLDLEDAEIKAMGDCGRAIDFHALRGSFLTMLARAGVLPAVARILARHSDVNLTLKVYTHLEDSELATAVGLLPDLSDRKGQGARHQIRHQTIDAACQPMSQDDSDDRVPPGSNAGRNSLSHKGFDSPSQAMSERRAGDSNPQPLAGHLISSQAAGQFAYPPGPLQNLASSRSADNWLFFRTIRMSGPPAGSLTPHGIDSKRVVSRYYSTVVVQQGAL